MAQQTINIGSAPNDGTGDPLRDAFDKVNDNDTELYAAVADHEDRITTLEGAGTGGGITLADAKAAMPPAISFPLGDGDGVIATGTYYLGVRVPVACTLTDAYLDLDVSGTLAVTVARATSAAPNTYSDLFTVTASGAQNASSTGLAHALAVGDRLRVTVGGTPATTEAATLNLVFARA